MNFSNLRYLSRNDWRSKLVEYETSKHKLEYGLNFISNLLIFKSYIQKCLQNIKQRLSRHFIYITWAKY
jgi:hypothetical protein